MNAMVLALIFMGGMAIGGGTVKRNLSSDDRRILVIMGAGAIAVAIGLIYIEGA
jgi:hypothetical protein